MLTLTVYTWQCQSSQLRITFTFVTEDIVGYSKYANTRCSNSSLGSWRARETKISYKGKCRCCGLHLKPLPKLSDEEFTELREAFMERSLKRKGNIFLNSTPEELDAYRNFLSLYAAKPFDVVIDGLNISHVTRQTAARRQRDDVVRKRMPFNLSLHVKSSISWLVQTVMTSNITSCGVSID